MASTYATTYAAGANAFSALDLKNVSTVKIPMAFSTQTVAQNETCTLYTIPAGTVLLGAMIKVNTAQSDISDVDLGISTDGSTNDTLVDGATLASTGYKAGGTNGLVGTGPLNVTATNYLVFTNKDAQSISTADIDVIVLMADMRVS